MTPITSLRNQVAAMAMDINSPIAPIIEPHIQILAPHTEPHTPPQIGVSLILLRILCQSSIHVHAPARASILSYWIVVGRTNFYAASLNQVGVTYPGQPPPQ